MRCLLLTLLALTACGTDVMVAKQRIDDDGDGFTTNVDCDDTHATVNPDAAEVCDGLDNDCDGALDEDATDAQTWYADADGDSFGDPDAPSAACDAPTGTVANADDCDDAEARAWPENPEVCDGVDNDCNGAVDDDPSDVSTFYVDADGDGYGDPVIATLACEPAMGEVADGSDCDDDDSAVHPDAPEDDCTDATDYNCDGSVSYADADGDGTPACEDCDDADATRSPTTVEVCDELDVDEDCNGVSDDADAGVTGAPTWGRDLDLDGYASATGATLTQCEQPTGYVATIGDCDDLDSGANPGATEICDSRETDEDCDGLADDADPSTDAASWNLWYADRDGDGHGDSTRLVAQCESPSGYVADDDDCDDADDTISPDATEVCDSADTDEDCDGVADDGDSSASGQTTWYLDDDGDGFAGPVDAVACDAPGGYLASSTDCDDTSPSVSPGASEICDALDVDEDCDGLADDADPSADGGATWYEDADGDGYAGTNSTTACEQPSGYLATSTDCDDAAADAYPGATEACGDGVDQDCSGADDVCAAGDTYTVDTGYDSKIYGVSTSDYFGQKLATGDFNGDGNGDLVVADTRYSYSGSIDGGVFGYYGPFATGAAVATANDAFLYYNTSSSYSGSYANRVYNLGDLDSDGNDDLFVGVADWTTAYVYLGGDTGVSTYTAAKDEALSTCDSAARGGDLDGTASTNEWICGYSHNSSFQGIAWLFSGTSTSSYATLPGETAGDWAGYAVAAGGDVDGDGLDDIWVGAPKRSDGTYSHSGAVYLVYAPITGWFYLSSADATITGGASDDYLGFSMTMPGDADGDGHDDLIASAYGDDSDGVDAGALYLFTDPVSGPAEAGASAVLLGEGAGDIIGYDGISTGDADGDGTIDLFAGSFVNSDGAAYGGATWLVHGPLSGTESLSTADARWLDTDASAYLGYATAVIPDADGDGVDELAMSAPNSEEGSDVDNGAVWIWSGR